MAWLPTLHRYRSAFVARHCRWGVTSSLWIFFLQLESQHRPWAYSGGLLQEPCEQGGDADAGGTGNVLIGGTGISGLGVGPCGLFWVLGPGVKWYPQGSLGFEGGEKGVWL